MLKDFFCKQAQVPSLPLLAYAVRENYPWPHFTSITAWIFTLLFTAITLINVVVAGHETVTIYSPTYQITSNSWWYLSSGGSSCAPYFFNPGDTIYTNLSTLPFTVSGNTNIAGFAYNGWTLSDLDELPEITTQVLLNNYGTSQRQVQGTASLTFRHDVDVSRTQGLLPRVQKTTQVANLQLSRRSDFTDPGILNFATAAISKHGTPDRNAAKTILLDGLASELLVAFDAEFVRLVESMGNSTASLNEIGNVSSNPNSLSCTWDSLNIPPSCVIYTFNPTWGFSWWNTSLLPQILNVSLMNYQQALRATVLSSFGIWTGDNAFTNSSTFSAMISPNNVLSAWKESVWYGDAAMMLSSTMWPDLNSRAVLKADKGSFALGALQNLPEFLNQSTTPATFNTDYLCQVQQLKSPFSLLVSVLVADASILTAAWGIYMGIASMIARRRAQQRAEYKNVHLESKEYSHKNDKRSSLEHVDDEPDGDTETIVSEYEHIMLGSSASGFKFKNSECM